MALPSTPVMSAALGHDVRERRRDLGLTQQDLADLAGTSARFVGALENGKPSVQLDKVSAVLQVLGLELRAQPRVIPAPVSLGGPV